MRCLVFLLTIPLLAHPVIERYCLDCHDAESAKGKLDLEALLVADFAANSAIWEQVLRKTDARHMPPVGETRPSDAEYATLVGYLDGQLAKAPPYAGRTDTFRRLNRSEYQNAIRDLLDLEIDASALLPADESSHGFDHITVGDLSPVLLTRYVQAARKISELAMRSRTRPDGKTYRIKPDLTQEQHVEGLPLGTRGGLLVNHIFPRAGEYEIQIRLTRDRNDEVEGLHGTHTLEVLLNNDRVADFAIAKPKHKVANHFDDSALNARFQAPAGPQKLGVTFVRNGGSIEETRRQPLNVHFNLHRHPRLSPAVYQVSIVGPFEPTADDGEASGWQVGGRESISRLARRAYRRPVKPADIERPMRFYREEGMESALSAILTSPHFLFKIERQPEAVKAGENYTISDLELASRLSFFIWSSVPDAHLLELAENRELRKPGVLEAEVRRMLADSRSRSLTTNFANQWLHLRNLDSRTPDGRLFPDFDDNLRQAMRRETELHFEALVREDGAITDLLQRDHSYLNERLAKHYGVPHVYGSRFRRVALKPEHRRGGLLRHGSILTVTSYATRTSPVIRGNWILENILGAPAPPPPDDVPGLDDNSIIAASLSVRERLSKHREDPACASCHNLMDPVGFALESFDAVGRWRVREGDKPLDDSGALPGGANFSGVEGLEAAILAKPERFVQTATEKLLTFALGRGLEPADGPTVRQIVREADGHRFSEIVIGIVRSTPFQMRQAE